MTTKQIDLTMGKVIDVYCTTGLQPNIEMKKGRLSRTDNGYVLSIDGEIVYSRDESFRNSWGYFTDIGIIKVFLMELDAYESIHEDSIGLLLKLEDVDEFDSRIDGYEKLMKKCIKRIRELENERSKV